MEQIYATGRRKSSTARVFLRPKPDGATGKITINKREMVDYFPRPTSHIKILSPLKAVDQEAKFNIFATVCGGGTTGQAEAIRHGIALALRRANPEWGPILRERGFVTRDARVVERKKVGLHKARRATQFSKR